MKSADASGFPLEKTTPNFADPRVHRALLNFFHRPAIRSGLRSDPRGRFRNPHFASFLAGQNRRRADPDRKDAALATAKLVRLALKLALFGGGAWIALESAKALSVF